MIEGDFNTEKLHSISKKRFWERFCSFKFKVEEEQPYKPIEFIEPN